MNNDFLQKLMQALQGGGQPQLPSLGQPQQQSQQGQGFDPSQLFQELISGAIQQTTGGKKVDMSKYNVPHDFAHGPLMHESMHQAESQATSQALMNGADPNLLDRAKQFLGQNAYMGLCEAFVERMTQGAEGIYASASDAWNKHQGSRQDGLSGVQPGDAVYFAPDASNQGYGHTGVYMGNGQFISATDNGIKQYNIQDWQNSTGQKVLGYVPQEKRAQMPRDQIYPQQPKPQQPMQIPSMSQQKQPMQQPQAQKPQAQANPLATLLTPKKTSVPSAPHPSTLPWLKGMTG